MTLETLRLTARTAHMCATPLAYVQADHLPQVSNADGQDVLMAFADHPAFAKPLNRNLSDTLGLRQLDIQPGTCTALNTHQVIQRATALALAPLEQLHAFAREVTAVRFHDAILKCILKSDRQKAQQMLGDLAYRTAVREAPLRYKALSADISQHQLFAILADEHSLLTIGASVLHSFVDTLDHGLAHLLSLRLPKSYLQDPMPLSDQQISTFQRLLLAKGPE